MTPGIVQYRLQKNGARRRGIPWQFTFEDWIDVWMASGHAEKRGRTKGAYVMARHGDAGPYSRSNVSIILFEQNCSDAHANGRVPSRAVVVDSDFSLTPVPVDVSVYEQAESYREVVRLAWSLRPLTRMTTRLLAELIDAFPSHVTDYLNADDAPRRRDLPARLIPAFEWVVGNTAVSQWLSAQTRDRA